MSLIPFKILPRNDSRFTWTKTHDMTIVGSVVNAALWRVGAGATYTINGQTYAPVGDVVCVAKNLFGYSDLSV